MDQQPHTEAIAKAERLSDIQFDFELEDIIAGNAPATDVGRSILAIVEDAQGLPTQGKVEAALTPLYEATAADFYRREGGAGEPPPASRQSLRQHAVKVIQARKVRRAAMARAARTPGKQGSFSITGFQLGAVAALLGLIVLVFWLRS